MAIDTSKVTQQAQLKAVSTAVLNQYAGMSGQLVFNLETDHMHVMTGTAGNTHELANTSDITAEKVNAYTKTESDGKYAVKSDTYTKAEVNQIVADSEVDLSGYLQKTEAANLYLGKTAKAASATTADSAIKAMKDGNGRIIADTYATKTELSSKADSSALANYVLTSAAESTYAKKTDISAVFRYKGTKDTQASLPREGNAVGDVWHVEDTSNEYAWTGTSWEALGGVVDLGGYLTKSEASSQYATKEELSGKADATSLASYLPLTGGTISGALTVNGGITGTASNATHAVNADSATKATQDASGNVIANTYATKAALSGYQVKGNYLTPESTLDYSKLVNIPTVIDYGTLQG